MQALWLTVVVKTEVKIRAQHGVLDESSLRAHHGVLVCCHYAWQLVVDWMAINRKILENLSQHLLRESQCSFCLPAFIQQSKMV
jgi:hypothetical protein